MGKEGKRGKKRKMGMRRKGNKRKNGKEAGRKGTGAGKEEDPYGKEVEAHEPYGKGLGPLLASHPAQLHFPSHSSRSRGTGPNFTAPLPALPTAPGSIPSQPLQPPQPPVGALPPCRSLCTANQGEQPDLEERGGNPFHSHTLTQLHLNFPGSAPRFEQRRSPCILPVPRCKSGMCQPAPTGARLPSRSPPSRHTWGMLLCLPPWDVGLLTPPHSPTFGRGGGGGGEEPCVPPPSHPASTGKSARQPAGRSREMSGSRALPHLGAGKTPPLPNPELVSPPRPVSRGEKHPVAGGRRDPFG